MNSSTTLPGGTYWFTSLTINAPLSFSGAATLNVNGNITIDSSLTASASQPANLKVYQIGTNRTFGDNSNNISITAVVIAPTSDFTSKNNCVIRGAKLVGNDAITIRDASTIEQYLSRSYISSGAGVRVIIPNLASINIDWGFPIYDPAERRSGCQTVSEATTPNGAAPECVKRREDDKVLGILTIPGAFYVGIGASF